MSYPLLEEANSIFPLFVWSFRFRSYCPHRSEVVVVNGNGGGGGGGGSNNGIGSDKGFRDLLKLSGHHRHNFKRLDRERDHDENNHCHTSLKISFFKASTMSTSAFLNRTNLFPVTLSPSEKLWKPLLPKLVVPMPLRFQELLWIVFHSHYLGHCFLGQSLCWLLVVLTGDQTVVITCATRGLLLELGRHYYVVYRHYQYH